jgi:hypothetical protein
MVGDLIRVQGFGSGRITIFLQLLSAQEKVARMRWIAVFVARGEVVARILYCQSNVMSADLVFVFREGSQ